MTEIELEVPDLLDTLGIESDLDGTITVDRVVSISDDSFLEYGTVDTMAIETLETVTDAIPGIASNATFTREDWIEVLSRIAFDNEFANAGAKAYQTGRGDDVAIETTARNPLARALLYNLRALDADGIDDQFDAVREKVLTHAARTRVFEKPVDGAIDIHDWLFYGEQDTPKVANTNPDQGTNLV